MRTGGRAHCAQLDNVRQHDTYSRPSWPQLLAVAVCHGPHPCELGRTLLEVVRRVGIKIGCTRHHGGCHENLHHPFPRRSARKFLVRAIGGKHRPRQGYPLYRSDPGSDPPHRRHLSPRGVRDVPHKAPRGIVNTMPRGPRPSLRTRVGRHREAEGLRHLLRHRQLRRPRAARGDRGRRRGGARRALARR